MARCRPTLRWSLLLLGSLMAVAVRADVTPERERVFGPEIAPLLKKYCLDCHSGDSAENDLHLDAFQSTRQVFDARNVWLKVLSRVRESEMPPKDAEQPTKEERQRLVTWLDGTLNDINCGQRQHPGHVTLRRLNRAEYRNTIRDLVGVDYAPTQDFPADDVGYGFDNIGDVLTLPTILLEKYLTAAEEISARAIVTKRGPEVVYTRPGSRLRGDGEQLGNVEGPRILTSDGEMTGRLRLAKSGTYELRVKAYEHHAGDEATKMAIRIDGKEVQIVDVTAPEGKPEVYKTEVTLDKGDRRLGLAFLNDYYRPDNPNPNDRDRNLIVETVEVVGPLNEEANLPESHRQILFVTPGEKVSADEATRRIVEQLASRAFRRPTTEEEIERLVRFARLSREQGDSFEQSIQLALQAMLVSPHFLFKVEANPPAGQSWRELNDWELAARLSYFLWSSMPDEELRQAAQRGGLRDAGELERQVRRMLADSRSQALVDNFATQWLQLRKFEEVTVSRRHFRSFSSQLRSDMRQETLLFFADLLRENRSLLTLLNADYSFLNERLARHYGVRDVEGSEFRRVSLDGTQRMGVLSHGSVLTVTSNPTRTSPVKRGKWILENLLGEPPPAPPPNVPELKEEEGDQLTGSLRQRMEQHRTNPSCSVCHQRMDSLGFALENFDAVGAWRTHDGKFPIDAGGELPTGEKFSGPRELVAVLLARQDAFVRCVAEKMLIYALGRGLEYYDRCAVDKITEALAKDDFRFATLMVEIARSEPFRFQGTKLN
jgi:hypothetical protein